MKLTVIFIAILGVFVFESDGMIRKCFPLGYVPSNTHAPSTASPTIAAPSTQPPSTAAPTTLVPTTKPPSTNAPTTAVPGTQPPATNASTTKAPTTQAPATTTTTTTIAPATATTTAVPTNTTATTNLATTTTTTISTTSTTASNPQPTTTTTTPTTTTTLGPPIACALWTRYNGDGAPSVNGFSAGISVISNTPAYVGRAMYDNDRVPARIQITTTTVGTNPKTPGGYIPWSNEFPVSFSEYLVVQEGCLCEWVSPSVAVTRAMVYTGDPNYFLVVGRHVFADDRVAITKVNTNPSNSTIGTQCYNPTSTTQICNDTPTEILVCESRRSTAVPPKITFNTESCGTWSSIGYANTAATNGFAAGLSIITTATVNDTAYIGRGQDGDKFTTGRYQATGVIGTYVSNGGNEHLASYDSEFLIVPEGCNCRWMTPDQGKIRKGLITTPDKTRNYMVGRKTFPNGLVSIMHVFNVYGDSRDVTYGYYAKLDKSEGEEYATEVLVCETLPLPPNACALWTRYNGDDAPSVNGFSAGTSVISNTTAYVGFGMYSSQKIPGRLQITTTTLGTNPNTAGLYISFGGYENFVKFSEYLVVPDGCSCTWMIPSIGSSHPGLIIAGDPTFGLAVGRKTFADGRIAVTKVLTVAKRSDYMIQWYNPTSNTEVGTETATELLVCETAGSTAAPPKVTFNTESCGMWSTIGTQFSSANAFVAGLSILTTATVNDTAYVGRGQDGDKFTTGRYQSTGIIGTYVSNGGSEHLASYGSEFLIVPEGCNCRWMTPDQGKIRKGLITTPDQSRNYMVGRKTFSNGLVSIMHVFNVYGDSRDVTYAYYAKLDKSEGEEYATEVLVCETLLPPPNACALWTRYNGDNGPFVNGFSAGVSVITNTTAYVGKGQFQNQRMPGRIQITTTTIGTNPKTAGGYFSWYGSENYAPYAEYLVVPDGCTCTWMNPSIGSSHPGLIIAGDPTYGHAVGRHVFADGRVAIGKIVTFAKLSLYMSLCYAPTSTTEVCNEPITELLVCETTASTDAPPKVTFASESCGMWSTIGYANTAATNGFAAGPSILTTATVNDTAYVGRGQDGDRFTIGRYQTTNVVGTYTSTGGTEHLAFGSEFLIVPQGCSCSWMNPDTARTRKGLIATPDQTYNFLVGKKALSNGIISIAHVNNVASFFYSLNWGWWADVNKSENSGSFTEVLICTAA